MELVLAEIIFQLFQGDWSLKQLSIEGLRFSVVL